MCGIPTYFGVVIEEVARTPTGKKEVVKTTTFGYTASSSLEKKRRKKQRHSSGNHSHHGHHRSYSSSSFSSSSSGDTYGSQKAGMYAMVLPPPPPHQQQQQLQLTQAPQSQSQQGYVQIIDAVPEYEPPEYVRTVHAGSGGRGSYGGGGGVAPRAGLPAGVRYVYARSEDSFSSSDGAR